MGCCLAERSQRGQLPYLSQLMTHPVTMPQRPTPAPLPLCRDCGLACVLMVLKALGLHQYDLPSLQLLCPTKSIWTIDLAHLLAKTLPGCAGARLTFLTTLLGANPSFASQHYYAEHLTEDAARVAQLFQVSKVGRPGSSHVAVGARFSTLCVGRQRTLGSDLECVNKEVWHAAPLLTYA